MPTNWAPCPGKRNAILLKVPRPLRLRRFDHFPAHVMSAIRTNHVRGHRRAALRARVQLLRLFGVVGSAGPGPGVGVFALWNGHGTTKRLRSIPGLLLGPSQSLRSRINQSRRSTILCQRDPETPNLGRHPSREGDHPPSPPEEQGPRPTRRPPAKLAGFVARAHHGFFKIAVNREADAEAVDPQHSLVQRRDTA